MSKNFISNVSMQYQYFDIQLEHPKWKGKKVLDFGGNVGNILTDPECEIEEANYWCLDVSKKAIEIGQMKYPEASFNFYNCYNLSFNPAGIEDLPIPDLGEKFDFILAYSIFTHIHKNEMIDKIHQLIKFLNKGGTLIFTFLDAHYNGAHHYPGFQDITNLEKRIRRLNNGNLLPELLTKGQGAQTMSLVNGQKLLLSDEEIEHLPQEKGDTLFTYVSPEFLLSTFNCSIKMPPGDPYHETYPAEMQHACIIKNVGV